MGCTIYNVSGFLKQEFLLVTYPTLIVTWYCYIHGLKALKGILYCYIHELKALKGLLFKSATGKTINTVSDRERFFILASNQ